MDHIYVDGDERPHLPTHHKPIETTREYIKLALVLVFIVVVSAGVTSLRGWNAERFANDFMAVFFMTFAAFKFVHLEQFVAIFRTYDLVSQRVRPYAYLYPFIEVFLGLGYFISTDAWQLNILTLLVTGEVAYSVWKKLGQKRRFACACLGTFIKLPLTKVSFVESGLMFIMAAYMLVT